MRQVKIVVEKHPEGYVSYPLGLQGIVVGEGDTYEEALADVTLALFLQVKDFKPLSRPFLQLLSQPDSCHVAQTHEAHGVATAVCGSKRLVEVRRICCYAPFATPSGGNAGT